MKMEKDTRKGCPYISILFLVCAFQNIVYACFVEIRKCAENVGRNHAFSRFIIGIGALRNVDCFAHFLLGHIRILTQIPNTTITIH